MPENVPGKLKCHKNFEKVLEIDRSRIHEHYWKDLDSYDMKQALLTGHLLCAPTQRRTVRAQRWKHNARLCKDKDTPTHHVISGSDDRFIKTVIFGDMEGTTRRGRPRREWLNDIQEWCNMDVYNLYTAAKNREEWSTIVRTSVDTNKH